MAFVGRCAELAELAEVRGRVNDGEAVFSRRPEPPFSFAGDPRPDPPLSFVADPVVPGA